jgi:hypothetical protein
MAHVVTERYIVFIGDAERPPMKSRAARGARRGWRRATSGDGLALETLAHYVVSCVRFAAAPSLLELEAPPCLAFARYRAAIGLPADEFLVSTPRELRWYFARCRPADAHEAYDVLHPASADYALLCRLIRARVTFRDFAAHDARCRFDICKIWDARGAPTI